MATIGREAARAPLTSADINDGIVGAQDLQATLDLSSKAVTLPALQSLTVSAAVPSIQMTDTDNNADAYIQATDGNLRFYADDSAEAAGSLITFNIDGGEKARIDDGGNVGIGTSSLLGKVTIVGSAASSIPLALDSNASYGEIQTYNSSPLYLNRQGNDVIVNSGGGNLLVGTTTVNGTGVTLGAGNYGYFSRSGDAALFVNRSTSDGNIIELRKADITVGSIGTGAGSIYIGSNSQSSGVSFYGTALYPNNGGSISATNGANDIGAPTARWKDLYLSGGVYLGGTGAANLLDDYEEGTFTPTVTGATTAGTTTYSQQHGWYTKTGNTVKITLLLQYTAMTGTGAMVVGGLPFSLSNEAQYYEPGTILPSAVNWDGGSFLVALGYSNNSFLRIYYCGDNAAALEQGCVNEPADFRISMTYRTA